MQRGKKSVAEKIVYGALDEIKEKLNADPVEVFKQAMENVKPRLEVKSRRVGGATYQVPVEVDPARQSALAMRWIVTFAQTRKGVSMGRALAQELMDAYKNQGNAVKKRDDTHKMAQANKAFAHYRW
jgi:small subunit ribosomal protein S7